MDTATLSSFVAVGQKHAYLIRILNSQAWSAWDTAWKDLTSLTCNDDVKCSLWMISMFPVGVTALRKVVAERNRVQSSVRQHALRGVRY